MQPARGLAIIAAAHLLADLDPGAEGLIAPHLERRLTAAIGGMVREDLSVLLRAQSDRLAGLLVRSGKDARASVSLGTAILEELTGDRQHARRLADQLSVQEASVHRFLELSEGFPETG